MTINPLNQKTKALDLYFSNICIPKIKPYNKNDIHPFTRLRLILLMGCEFESVKFSHCFSRNVSDNNIRRALALTRRQEQQQQKVLASIKPINETMLEHTIGYEQLAVELTSILAKREENNMVKKSLDFALLEDFDHLYRYADLLDMDEHVKAEHYVGRLTEIMPGRPTVSEHRHPFDSMRVPIDVKKDNKLTVLDTLIITAAEQQTMNYYMNVGGLYRASEIGRLLYSEIAMIEEQHVSEYGSLLDTRLSFYENAVLHEYTECYLYYSMFMDETDSAIKSVYESMYEMECAHLKEAVKMLKDVEHKESDHLIGNGEFPELLSFSSNIEYVRGVIKNQIELTAKNEDLVLCNSLPKDSRFFVYNETVTSVDNVPSHNVIEEYINNVGSDYRFQEKPHPIKALQERKEDNIEIGRY